MVGGLRGRPVRPVSRSTPVRFDWALRDTWEGALASASAAYVVAPAVPDLAEPFVAQALAAGVRRFVVLSARGLEHVAAESFRAMGAMEDAVRASGAEWTILRPNNFNQNFDEDLWVAPLRAGRLALPIGAMPDYFVDAQDIADVAVAALTADGHAGQVYELTGPRGLTFAEAVATMAKAAGREIEFVELTPSAYREELLADGVPVEFADELNAVFTAIRAGHVSSPGDGVRRALGRDPIDFADYATRAASAWRAD